MNREAKKTIVVGLSEKKWKNESMRKKKEEKTESQVMEI